MKKLFFALLLAIFILLPSPIQATYFGSGDNLSFPKTQKFNETVFLAGKDITIDSDIVGDLICAGQNITINSKITGDVICASQNLKINGTVNGNVRSVGQQIEISGLIYRNVSIASQSLLLSNTSQVKGDLFYGVQNLNLQGFVGRDLAGGSESLIISGSLLRNAKVATQKIIVADTANLGGDLQYYIEKTGTEAISQKAIKGKIDRHEVVIRDKEQFKKEIKKSTPVFIILKVVFSLLSSILLTFFLLHFIPARVKAVSKIIKSHPFKSALVGFATLIAGPVVIIILCLTFVGLGLASVVALFYILSLILSFSFVAVRVGEIIAEKYGSAKTSDYLSAIFGCLLLGLIIHIPVLGALVGFFVFLVGLGASMLSYFPVEN